MKVNEITKPTTVQPNTPDKARINSLKTSVDAAKSRLDAERKRQKVQKAQMALQRAISPQISSIG